MAAEESGDGLPPPPPEAEVKEEVEQQEEKTEESTLRQQLIEAHDEIDRLRESFHDYIQRHEEPSGQHVLLNMQDRYNKRVQQLEQRLKEERPSVVVNYSVLINNSDAGAMIGDVQVLPSDIFEPDAGQCFIANCSICGETFQGTQVRILQCGHMFHDSCYLPWRNRGTRTSEGKNSKGCPACRNELSPPQPPPETSTPPVSQESIGDSPPIICGGCIGCDYECPYEDMNEVGEEGEVCESCEYEPNLQDAFSKFGHNDGGACKTITDNVKYIIEELGYQVRADRWGSHNYCIMEIKRGDEIVYPIEGFEIGGYDERDFEDVLPDDINDALRDAGMYWEA